MKKLLPLVLLFSVSAHAVSLPSISRPTGSDRVSGNGFSCESSLASQTTMQFGVAGGTISDTYSYDDISRGNSDRDNNEVMLYAQISMPLFDDRKRVDCSRLYDLELEARQLEIQQRKAQIKLMEMSGQSFSE